MELSIGSLLITITKCKFFFRPDNMPRSTHKCLNIYYSSYDMTLWFIGSASEIYRKKIGYIRAVFRGGGAGGATAPPDVFDLLQNSETNLQKYWAFKLALVVKSNIS